MILLYYLLRLLFLLPLHQLVKLRMRRLDAKHKRLRHECLTDCAAERLAIDAKYLQSDVDSRTVAWARAGARLAMLDERCRKVESRYDWYTTVESAVAGFRARFASVAGHPLAAFLAGVVACWEAGTAYAHQAEIIEIATTTAQWASQVYERGGGA